MISALIAFEGGIAVLRLNRRRSINIVYAVFAFNFVLCCILFNQYVTAPVKSISLIWNRILAFPGSLNAAFMLHFAILLVSKNEQLRQKWLLPFLYLPSFLIGLMWVLGRSIQDVYRTQWGWDNYSTPGNIWVNFSVILFIALCLASFLLVLYRFLRPFGERNKDQMRPIMFSLLMGTLGWFVSLTLFFSQNDLLHTLVSNLSFLIIVTPFTVGVRLAIARYHLMTLSPQRQAAELISGMNEPVFLVDMKGTVVFQNSFGGELAKKADLRDPYAICDLFICSETVQKELNAISAGKSRGDYMHVTTRDTEQMRTAYLLKLQGIKNETDEFIGALCILSEEKSLGDFQNRYGITPREIDVLFLSLSGFTNKEIARKLDISQRTVEHHHENIYNKLGIDNKIELYNIALKYRIISN